MADTLPTRDAEPTLQLIRDLRRPGPLTEDQMAAALQFRRPALPEVPEQPPRWDDLQILPAQLATKPLAETQPVDTSLVLGGGREKPHHLATPLLVELDGSGQAAHGWLKDESAGLQVLSEGGTFDPRGDGSLYVRYEALVDERIGKPYRAGMRMVPVPVGVRLGPDDLEGAMKKSLQLGANFFILDAGAHSIAGLARARRSLDALGVADRVALIIAGDLRTPMDFIKALSLGADGVLVARSTIEATRRMDTRQGPDQLRERLSTFIHNSIILMNVMARACGHASFSDFHISNLTTWHPSMAEISGVQYSGYTAVP